MIDKRTKIIATIGVSSFGEDIIEKMVTEGVDGIRINFSHASFEMAKEYIKRIKLVDKKLGTNTAIIADLQGPKLRVGKMEDNCVLAKRDTVTLICRGHAFIGNRKNVYMEYASLAKDVRTGQKILVDDGALVLQVVETDKISRVIVEVIEGGLLKSKKGVNLPNTKISLPALTEKDKKDALFAIENNLDWIALSFVKSSKDVISLRKFIEKHGKFQIPIISKIEKPEAIENIESIIKYSNALMVARGDLGVEIKPEEVPLKQKELVILAKKARKPVIIATQMMETMVEKPIPTRAEVNDVANSVMDGADAVMLSGETAVGKYPVKVIRNVSSVLKAVEDSEYIKLPNEPPANTPVERYVTKTICYHAAMLANETKAKTICTLTNSGYTAYQISGWRPKAYILVFTSNKSIIGQLNILWGVKAVYYNNNTSTDNTIEEINQIAAQKGYLSTKDTLINLSSMPIKDKGMVNTLRVSIFE